MFLFSVLVVLSCSVQKRKVCVSYVVGSLGFAPSPQWRHLKPPTFFVNSKAKEVTGLKTN